MKESITDCEHRFARTVTPSYSTHRGSQFLSDKQHLLTLIAVGGLYEPAAADMIREALAPHPDYTKAILDLGTLHFMLSVLLWTHRYAS